MSVYTKMRSLGANEIEVGAVQTSLAQEVK